MAATGGFRKVLESFEEKNNFIWRKEVVRRLKWSAVKWESEGEKESFWYELVNSVKTWGRKLAKVFTEFNVIIGLHDGNSFGVVQMVAVLEAIINLKPDIFIKGFADMRNPRYVAISFLDVQTKNYVLENLCVIGSYNVVFLNWAANYVAWDIAVEWLPVEVNIVDTKSMLLPFFEIVEEERVHCTLMSGTMVPTGKVLFKGVLRKGIDVHDVPYIASVNELDCKIKIIGRRIKCFDCGTLGHVAKRCPKFICLRCFERLTPEHVCSTEIRGAEGGLLGSKIFPSNVDQVGVSSIAPVQEEMVGRLAASSEAINHALDSLRQNQSRDSAEFWMTDISAEKEEVDPGKTVEEMDAQLTAAKRKLDGVVRGQEEARAGIGAPINFETTSRTYSKKAFKFGDGISDNLFFKAAGLPDHNG